VSSPIDHRKARAQARSSSTSPDRDFVHEALGDDDKGPFEPFDDEPENEHDDERFNGGDFDPPPPRSEADYGFDSGNQAGKATAGAELDVRDAGDDTEPPPPRRWLLGNQFCRRFLSGLVAPGSTGKTALRMLQCLSLAIGRALTGQHVFKRCRVLMVSLEDDSEEMRRRILAARLHYGIKAADVKGWLFYATPKGIKLAEIKDRSRQAGLLEKQLRAWIEKRRPDLLMLDPFVKLHALEENDNSAMDFVCDLLVTLAIEYDIAVDAPHHTKKGQLAPGDPDAGRGGSAARDAGRLVYTLTTMGEDEAKQFGINPEDRAAYIRLDKAKVNLAPPARVAVGIFVIAGVDLG
jgi:RecA-family ATPase